MKKEKIMIIGLSIALFALAQYIIYEKITESRQQELDVSGNMRLTGNIIS